MTCKDCNHFFVCEGHVKSKAVEQLCTAFERKAPCSIGDVLWYVPEEYEDFDVFKDECGYCEIHVTDVGARHIYFSSFDPPGEDVNEAIPIDQIGVTLFYTEEEAKRAAEWRRSK